MANQPYEVKIQGLDRVIRKFDRLGRDLTPEMERTTEKAALLFIQRIPEYPPARAGSSYRRTGTLGRKWTKEVKRIPKGVQGKVGTNVGYAPWVVSEETSPVNQKGPQSWFHADTWWTIQQVAKDVSPEIMKLFRQMVRRLIRS